MDLLRFVTFSLVVILAVLYFLCFEFVLLRRPTFFSGSDFRFGSHLIYIVCVTLFDSSLARYMLWYIPTLHRFAQNIIGFADCSNISGRGITKYIDSCCFMMSVRREYSSSTVHIASVSFAICCCSCKGLWQSLLRLIHISWIGL